ncbi:unnamed protein product [Lupinus luteus]|uniref:Uncharacterized protein n=1 Tax=Lupinus luteus TaxID=3873 RepID=A0AAV1W0Y5_LUPLU
MQMMYYGLGPLDMPFASGFPPDPFGMNGYMMPPIPPHRYAHFLDGTWTYPGLESLFLDKCSLLGMVLQ